MGGRAGVGVSGVILQVFRWGQLKDEKRNCFGLGKRALLLALVFLLKGGGVKY